MLKEVFTLGTHFFGFVGVVSLAVRVIIYYYLDTINGYGDGFGYPRSVESILYYDKMVRVKDEGLKRFCNLILKIGWWSIGFAIISLCFSSVMP